MQEKKKRMERREGACRRDGKGIELRSAWEMETTFWHLLAVVSS